MKSLLIFIATVLVSQSTSADCLTASGNFRKCYDNSNAPPALLYKMFVRDIFADSLEDEESRIGWHYVEAGLTPNMNSADVVRYFVPKFLEIEKEVEETQTRMLCFDGKPRYDGAENFELFSHMDDVELAIYEKHLIVAKSDLSASGLFDLDKALREYPVSFISIYNDHKAVRHGSIERIYKNAEALCKGPREYGFSSSRSISDG